MTLAISGILLVGSALSTNVNAQEINNEVNLPPKAERPEYNTTPPDVDNKWDGTTNDTEWLDQGTKKSPYLIFTPEEFYIISELKQTDINDTSISLSWSIIPRATGYEIYRSITKDGEMKLIGTTVDYRYTDKSAGEDGTYFYKVRAYRTENGHTYYGPYSEVLESVAAMDYIERFCVADVVSDGLKAEGMIFNWTSIEQADGYEVVRTKGSESKVFDFEGAERNTLIMKRCQRKLICIK